MLIRKKIYLVYKRNKNKEVKKIILPLLFLFYITTSLSQNQQIDSLLTAFSHASNDFQKAEISNSIAKLMLSENPQQALKLSQQALSFASNANNKKEIAKALKNIGIAYYYIGFLDSSLEFYKKAIKEFNAIGDLAQVANINNNIGLIYTDWSDYEKALIYYQRCLKIEEKLNNDDIAGTLSNIGNIYFYLQKYKLALKYYRRSLAIDTKIDDQKSIANDLNNLGAVYEKINKNNKALDCYSKSIKIRKKIGDKLGLGNSLNNLGYLYFREGDFKKALDYFFESLAIRKEIGSNKGIISSYINIGSVYKDWSNYKKAFEFYKKAEEISAISGMIEYTMDIHLAYSEIYRKTQNFEQALNYYTEYIKTRDSIFDTQKNKQIFELQTRFETERKDKEISLLNKDKSLKEVEMRKKNIILSAVIIALLLIIFLAFAIYKGYKTKNKANILLFEQKQEIEEKNEELKQQQEEILTQRDNLELLNEKISAKNNEMTDSIHYAKNIQLAVLPKKEFLNTILNEYFIFFKPKDIVSGDFYWVAKRNNVILIAAVDCTGHGVPGAFMSMLGISFLNEIISRENINTASQVLDELRSYIVKSLQQSGVSGEQKDGMDMAFCVINTNPTSVHDTSDVFYNLEFAGANNPLYIIPDKNKDYNYLFNQPNVKLFENEIKGFEIKPDKMPIAIYERMIPFTNYKVKIRKGDSIYLFSDGYVDQFGGPKKRKFLTKNFKTLLCNISDKSMIEQKQIISKAHYEWKGSLDQVDDILVIGLKL